MIARRLRREIMRPISFDRLIVLVVGGGLAVMAPLDLAILTDLGYDVSP